MKYHRFVKTTPKPSATKKSKGELFDPDSPLAPGVDDGEGVVMVVRHNGYGRPLCSSTTTKRVRSTPSVGR